MPPPKGKAQNDAERNADSEVKKYQAVYSIREEVGQEDNICYFQKKQAH
jgi:hypothetical protein